ncbi:interferon-stimulated 20 kDa exonuclease-like 2 [Tyto alba]|uniref:interferon-stimulated 20 kDa exonuclease-like 2 n=1 Tax=Tyto alba TaxID=56313 RepID=UPI001C669DEC|nr:interferon-stimulated 20 kDa exonuclease-like 2 [Tyto alba]
MGDLILNLDLAPPGRRGRARSGNPKHERFVRRRRALERRGALKPKQLPVAPPPGGGSRKKPGKRGGRRKAAARGGGAESPVCIRLNPGHEANGPASPPQQRGGGGSAGSKAPEVPAKPRRAAQGEQRAPSHPTRPRKLVAIDCEMVGTGPGGRTSALARCSIVSEGGDVLYDQYVRPTAPVVDYRTRWSGIRRQHLVNAVPFGKAQREILRILAGKIVVGHAICNDFKALKYFHPKALTRDTSKIPLLNRKGGFPEHVAISLKRLTKELLHKDIQVGKSGHSSVEDARATMELYKVVEVEWEQHLMLNPEKE